jgi:ABC-type iron transport system FetAB permease component
MQNEMEDDEMIRINKRKFLIAALVILLTGILIGQQMVQAKSDTYEDLKNFTQAMEIIKRNIEFEISL